MSDPKLCEASTSGTKRRKIQVRNENNLTNEELLRILADSDFDLDDSDIEGSYIPSDLDSSSEDDYDIPTNDDNVVPPDDSNVTTASDDLNEVWSDTCAGMKDINFTKTPGFLIDFDLNASPYDYFRLLDDDLLRYKVCWQNKIRKDSSYHCTKCPDAPGLCVGRCFEEYHRA
ncbi:unnamed protein product [Acanthoscelides obtectus]|uniref:PiggyBac transposable element-derived protein 4 C-terminal zinc-finger domain-containing protein n=1 Tax=Acanthoscelides obtectus TaxID=200917 RepID=A0A9P0LAM2_ACAOB|nr:unnamed protein product [Acanthoscelides obtectus]CAK1635660.1 hypothetical protein AOBTE_LOCUS9422 [Acanthoscelides obtectus]